MFAPSTAVDRVSRAGSTFSFNSNAFDELQPLKSMAERVSEQVEAYAESVDRWSSRLHELKRTSKNDKDVTKGAHTFALELLQELRKIVEHKTNELQSRHTVGGANGLSKSWQGRLKGIRGDDETSSLVLHDDQTKTVSAALDQAQGEQNTLELLNILATIRFPDPTSNFQEQKQEWIEAKGALKENAPGAEIWERFLLENDPAREKSMVLKWLESSAVKAEPKFETIVDQLQAAAGQEEGTWSRGWLSTRERIKSAKRLQPTGGVKTVQELDIMNTEKTASLAVQLDPDVVQRQGRSLEKMDERYEASLWLACFIMLRRGMKWKEIKEWFEERNEGWRAASLGITNTEEDSRIFVDGPHAGALWRRVCYVAARRGSSDPNERAVYGLLAGDLDSVEPVCRSWDDHLYVNYNAALIAAFEQYLGRLTPIKLNSTLNTKFPLTVNTGTLDLPEQIIEKLGQQRATSAESRSPLKTVQGALLAGHFDDFVYQLGIAISKKLNDGKPDGESDELISRTSEQAVDTFSNLIDDFEMIGLIVHVHIVYEALNDTALSAASRRLTENVVVYYMDYIRKLGKVESIPTYAGLLLHGRKELVLGTIMTDITNREEQKKLVELMAGNDIEMPRMLHQQLWYSLTRAGLTKGIKSKLIEEWSMLEASDLPRWPGQRIAAGFRIEEPNEDEARIIQAAEWYMFVQSDWNRAFEVLSYAMRAFLLTGRWSAALAVQKRINFHELSLFKSTPYFQQRIDVFSPDDEEILLAELHDPAPALDQSTARRTTRAAARATSEQPSGMQAHSAEDLEQEREKVKYLLRKLRRESKQFLEMQQLCFVLERLAIWREIEDQAPRRQRGAISPADYVKVIRVELEELELAMAPLLQGNFMTEIPVEIERRNYNTVLQLYIPQILLAYNTALIYASNYLGPATLLTSFQLANTLAAESTPTTSPASSTTQPLPDTTITTSLDNSHLTRAILNAGAMQELVQGFGFAARQLLQLNQEVEARERIAKSVEVELGVRAGKRKGKGKRGSLGKRKGWGGENLDLWDPVRGG